MPPQRVPNREPFVHFPTDLFDALLLSPMPATHKEVVLAVIRRTYGHFAQEQASISLALFQGMTGRAERGIRDALSDLLREGVLRRTRPATNRRAAVYQVETETAHWGKFRPKTRREVGPQDELEREPATTPGCEQATTLECPPPTTREDSRYIEESLPSVGASGPPRAAVPLFTVTTPSKNKEPASGAVRDLVAYAARLADDRRLTLTPATKAQLGRALKDLLQGGADPQMLLSALDTLVLANRSPSHLRYILGDLERGHAHGRARTSRRHHLDDGRSKNGEFL
ncbi:MAG: replication protein [Thermoleophilia bacterium]|nr:replication protein [Thermoleophilia bacterium]